MPSVVLHADIPKQAFDWRNCESIWKWCRQNGPISEAHHKRWLESLPGNPSIRMFGIAGVDDYVGVCGLTSIDRINSSAEFSLYIAPPFQRMGYARAALTKLLEHAFFNENLNRVWGETFEGNPALELFKSVGMRIEGIKKDAYFRNGKYIDCTMVAILSWEYVMQRGGSGYPVGPVVSESGGELVDTLPAPGPRIVDYSSREWRPKSTPER